jgi:hypothetical protein
LAVSSIAGKFVSIVVLSLAKSPVFSMLANSVTVSGVQTAFAEACALQLD